MRRTKSSDSSAVPGSMWLKSRSIEKEAAPTKLGGSLTGCEGRRSISTTILPPIANSKADGQGGSLMPKSNKKKRTPKRVLGLPDLEQAESAVLNSLTSLSGQGTYDHAITDFVEVSAKRTKRRRAY